MNVSSQEFVLTPTWFQEADVLQMQTYAKSQVPRVRLIQMVKGRWLLRVVNTDVLWFYS